MRVRLPGDVDLLIYDFSVHMVLTISTPNCATVRVHRMTKYLAINPSDDNTWYAIMSTPSSLLAFFTQDSLICFGSMVHLDFFNHPVLSIIWFSCQLIFNKLLYTEPVERKPLPALTKLLHGLYGLSFEKVTAVIWRSEKGKKGWGMNRLQIKIMVLKFCSSCYLRLLGAPDKTLEHLCKSCDNRKPYLVL